MHRLLVLKYLLADSNNTYFSSQACEETNSGQILSCERTTIKIVFVQREIYWEYALTSIKPFIIVIKYYVGAMAKIDTF